VNHAVLAILNPQQVEVEIFRADELDERRGLSSELDEMWSFVARKSNPRWLWHAIDHHTGKSQFLESPGCQPSLGLADHYDVIGLFSHCPFGRRRVDPRLFEQRVKVSMRNPARPEIICPDRIDLMVQLAESRVGMPNGTRRPGVWIRRHVGNDEKSKRLLTSWANLAHHCTGTIRAHCTCTNRTHAFQCQGCF
jgi:hypothetical protein